MLFATNAWCYSTVHKSEKYAMVFAKTWILYGEWMNLLIITFYFIDRKICMVCFIFFKLFIPVPMYQINQCIEENGGFPIMIVQYNSPTLSSISTSVQHLMKEAYDLM